MAKKNYFVAAGNAFTAAGHIYVAGEEIPENVFSDKNYLSKMISAGKIIEAKKTEEAPAEIPTEEAPADEPVETSTEEAPADEPATKRSTAKGGK